MGNIPLAEIVPYDMLMATESVMSDEDGDIIHSWTLDRDSNGILLAILRKGVSGKSLPVLKHVRILKNPETNDITITTDLCLELIDSILYEDE